MPVEIVQKKSGSGKCREVVFVYRKSRDLILIDEICSRIPGVEMFDAASGVSLCIGKRSICEFQKVNGFYWCFSEGGGLPVDKDTSPYIIRWITAAAATAKPARKNSGGAGPGEKMLFSPIPDAELKRLRGLLSGKPSSPSEMKMFVPAAISGI